MDYFKDEVAKKRYLLAQYDTHPDIVDFIIDIVYKYINLMKKDPKKIVFIEPAAGNGNFFNALYPYMIGIDIDESLYNYTQNEYIYTDFLSIKNIEDIIYSIPDSQYHIKMLSKYLIDNGLLRANTIIITNPPFSIGKKGARSVDMALKFLNKSAEFADTVCMILPASYNRKEKQNKVNPELHLIYSVDLFKNGAFERRGNIDKNESSWAKSKSWSVKTIFQIWARKYDENGNVIKREINNDIRWSVSKYKDGTWIYIHPETGEIMDGDFIILRPTDKNCNIMVKKWSNPTLIGKTETNPSIILEYVEKNILLEKQRNNDEKYINRSSKSKNGYVLDRSHVPDYFLYADNVEYVKNIFSRAKPYIQKKYKSSSSTNHATLSQIDMIMFYLDSKYNLLE